MQSNVAKKLGKQGEDLAASYLLRKQYTILARNYRQARGEIDIIARKHSMLVFIEVKTAGSGRFGPPETWVTEKKQRKIGQIAERYLQEHEIENCDCRFDVIAVELKNGRWTVKHIENAFWL